MERVLSLAMHRVARTRGIAGGADSSTSSTSKTGGGSGRDVDYEVLYTTGPDVITEAIIGIRDADYTLPPTATPVSGAASAGGP